MSEFVLWSGSVPMAHLFCHVPSVNLASVPSAATGLWIRVKAAKWVCAARLAKCAMCICVSVLSPPVAAHSV